MNQRENNISPLLLFPVEVVAYHNHGILVAAEELPQDMDDGQCDALVYGMGSIFLRFDIERIDVGKCRMIAGIIKEIGMVSDAMPCCEK